MVKNPLIGAWNSIHLEWSNSGLLYANIGNQLYVIDPETLKYQFIVNTVSFTLGKDGNIYFSKYNNRTVLAKISVFEKEKFEWGQIPVTNASFENGHIGWTSMFQTGVGYTYSVTNEKAHSGQSSLKIDDASRNQSVAIYSNPIPVQPNGIYKSSVQMFIESGTPSLLVRIYDKDGNQLAEEAIQVKNASEQKWQYVEQKITAPEYAAFARLFALSTSYALTSTYFDDFSFFALKEKPETIQKIYLTIAPTELTRGMPAAYSVKAITNRGKEFPVNAVLSISDEEVAKLEGNRLIALNPGSVEVRAIVVENGRQLISEPVEVKVVVTFASLKEYLSKLKNTNQIPHPVYMRLFNHLKQAEQHKLNGRTDQAKHHLYKTIEWLEKENRKIDHSIKNDLSIDIQFLIHHLDE